MKIPDIFLPVAILCVAFITALTSCRPPLHYLPYSTGISMYLDGTLVTGGAELCNNTEIETRFGVKCNTPMQRIELTATNDSTQEVKVLYIDTVGATSYSDTIYFRLDTPGKYTVVLTAITVDEHQELAHYHFTSLGRGYCTIAQPANYAAIPYNTQLQGIDISGIVNSPNPISMVRIDIIDSANISLSFTKDIALSGSGPVYSYIVHAPVLQPGYYFIHATTNERCYPWGSSRFSVEP